MKKSIFLVEDHPIMRRGIRDLISESNEFEVAGEVGDLISARNWLESNSVDLVLLDLSLPDGFGIDLIPVILKSNPTTKIVILTMHRERPYMDKAMKAGAHGFLLKDMAPEQLIQTLRDVFENRFCFYHEGRDSTPSLSSEAKYQFKKNLEVLSKREFTVLQLLAAGNSLTEIASQIDISVKTVFTYRSRILQKMNLHSNIELIDLFKETSSPQMEAHI